MRIPLVSIGMPVRNGAQFIRKALDSIIAQEYEDFELIISDNASDDGTGAICREYAQRDRRLRYYWNSVNQGAAANYNRVVELSRGKYFKWATHDDECLPGLLSRCVAVLEEAPQDVILVYPKSVFIDGSGQILYRDDDDLDIRDKQSFVRLGRMLARVNMVNAIFGVFRMSLLARTRLIDRFVGSDYILMGEAVLLGEIWEIPETLLRRRKHARMSMLANPTPRERRIWFDPRQTNSGVLATWFPNTAVTLRLVVEWEKSVKHLPLKTIDKLICYATVPIVWYCRLFRDWAGRQKRRVTRFLDIPLPAGPGL